MKAFIEKLIGRLEEERRKQQYLFYNVLNNEYQRMVHAYAEQCYLYIADIVNQLAEEYKQCNRLSCNDCEVYDKEKHYCPKWCDVIKHTTEELAEEYNNGWIPCSERLPEENGWYLVTNELEVVQQQCWGASHWHKLRDDAVIAWKPLPKPYQPKGE